MLINRICRDMHATLGANFKTPHFEVCAYLSNLCVPDDRDLSTGSNFNPRNTQCIPPVKIFAFLDLEQISADFGLKPFETGSLVRTDS